MAQRQASDVARLTYDSSVNASRIVELAPTDQQVLFEKLLNAVTATGVSTQVYTLDKKELTIAVVASSITDGGTFTFEGSPDGTNWGTVGSISPLGTTTVTQGISANGTTFYEIVNASSLKYFRVNLSARTDGTYTVYLMARS